MTSTVNQPAVAARGALLRRNSLASAFRAASTSLSTILLPIVLVVALPEPTYAIWALVSSIAAFTLYFDLGAQGAVLALVGRADAEGDDAAATSAGRAGLRVATCVGAIAVLVGVVLAVNLHSLFPSIAPDRAGPAAVTMILLFVGQGLSLAGTALASYFGGRQRTALATSILVPARFGSLILTCGVAFAGADLVVLGVAFIVPLLVGVLVLGVRFARESHKSVPLRGSRTTTMRGLLRYSGTLILWNVCMLVVSGVDLALVGRLDFSNVAPYAVASTIAVGIAGLDNAVLAPLLPELSGQLRLGDHKRVTQLLAFATRINSLGLAGAFVVVGASAGILAELLLPAADGVQVGFVMLALVGANCLRLAMAPLSLAFVAGGTHSRLVLQPLLEAGVNLGASIALGSLFGALGVALGTVIGAVVGVAAAVGWSLRVSGHGLATKRALIRNALIVPLIGWGPALVALLVVVSGPLKGSLEGVVLMSIGAMASAPGLLILLGPAGRVSLRRLLPSRAVRR